MPVKIEEDGENISPIVPKDIDNLVKGIRDRLCLKSQEKLSKFSRSTPYSVVRSPCRDVGGFHSHLSRGACIKCTSCKRSWKKHDNSCSCSELQESPQKLLEKLLHEQTLIQEAVRRLKSMNSMEPSAITTSSSPVMAAHYQTPPHEQSQLDLSGSTFCSKSSSRSSFSFGTVSPDVHLSETV